MIDDIENINEENIISSLHNYSSIKLAEMIITHRYLGFYPSIASASMEELCKRRLNGDQFDFELYIDQNLKQLPKLNFAVQDMFGLINTLRNIKK